MLVTLEEMKAVLEIEEGDTSQDARLTRLILGASAWVEKTTNRYFGQPQAKIEVRQGSGTMWLYLLGHIDGPFLNNPSVVEPGDELRVWSRMRGLEWTELTEGDDWEREGDKLLRLGGWSSWSRWEQFMLEYLDGYLEVPDDIKALIIEMVTGAYNAEANQISALVGVTGEKIGDYSYTLNPAAVAAAASAGFLVTDTGMSTINNWRRKFV